MHYNTKSMEWMDDSRAMEELDLPSGKLRGFVAKSYKYSTLIAAIFGIGMCIFQSVAFQSYDIALVFGVLGIVCALMLPTLFSYQCFADRFSLKVKYYILFFQVEKECHWSDVKYKKIKRAGNGRALSIRLYSAQKKMLISFSSGIVGISKIIKMAKSVSKLK